MKNKNVEINKIEGIEMNDYPDFCDAYVVSALIDGIEANEYELSSINENRELIQNHIIDNIIT